MQFVQKQQGEKHEPPYSISLATENEKQTPIVILGKEHSITFCDIITDTAIHCTIHPGGKRKRCGQCAGCKSDDCRACPKCRDMKKFGGSGRKKQACVNRKCLEQVSQTQDENKSSKPSSPCSLTVVKHTFSYVHYEPLSSKHTFSYVHYEPLSSNSIRKESRE